jgi:hypothetical protein
MNIDFHYGVVYIVARVGGMTPSQALTVAHACQYVDDATTPGILRFQGGETFERFATAHKTFDYANTENDQNRLVWAPFHFLPAGEGATLDEKAVCRADSAVAREVVRRAIRQRSTEMGLHRLGVTLHTYVDTWAHQGFAGIESPGNRVHSLEAQDCTRTGWLENLTLAMQHLVQHVEADVLTLALPVGHGAALHYPDQPWAKWHYIDGRNMFIQRHNLPEFVEAADMKATLTELLDTNRIMDDNERLRAICEFVKEGGIPGLKEAIPDYVPKGVGSWKYKATGLRAEDDSGEKPVWSEAFEKSDYRLFHDAVKQHRFVTTQEVLPAHGLRIA